MAYTCAKYLISQGRTNGLADKLDVLLLNGRLTDEQYSELIGLLPTGA
jgi:translation initiation factor 2 beta subunit (eIF-2beta)/eIF-5